MLKAKFFEGRQFDTELEQQLNNWLASQLPDIVSVTQSGSDTGAGRVLIVVIYRVPAPHPHR